MLTFEHFEDDAGEHRWRAIHANGNVLFGASEGYKNRGDARQVLENALAAIKAGEYVVLEQEPHAQTP